MFNFVYFVGRTHFKFKIPTKKLFTLVVLHIICNPPIQVSTNMSSIVKPRNVMPTKLNDFTVSVVQYDKDNSWQQEPNI